MKPFILSSTLLLLASCASLQPLPRFALTITDGFDHHIGRHTYRQGAPLVNDAIFGPINRAERATAVVCGNSVDPAFVSYAGGGYGTGAEQRGWRVEVQSGASDRVLRALQNAKDGYEADLGCAINASARIYPRFTRKHFSWGEAVSFIVQYQNDNTNYVPNNGMMIYEVHGVTHDRRYTIRASFGITHPRLTEFGPQVRDCRDDAFKADSPMRRDRDYLLVERCPDTAFQPSLKSIDAMLETLKLGISE
ncbi:hypothetical protein BH11VER1_BH11VER1_36500 [soil metagenome]